MNTNKYLLFRKNRKTGIVDGYMDRRGFTQWDKSWASIERYSAIFDVYQSAIKKMKKDYEFFMVRLGSKKSKMEIKWHRNNVWTTQYAEWSFQSKK